MHYYYSTYKHSYLWANNLFPNQVIVDSVHVLLTSRWLLLDQQRADLNHWRVVGYWMTHYFYTYFRRPELRKIYW